MTAQQEKPTGTSIISEDEILYRKSFVFVLDVLEFNEKLKKNNKYLIADKILKQATSFGELIMAIKLTENENEKKTFVKKSLIDAHKTKYLLQLCKYSEDYPSPSNLLLLLEDIMQKLKDNISSSN